MRWSPRSVLLAVAFVVLDLVIIGVGYALSHRESDPPAAAAAGSTEPSPSGDAGTPPIQGPLVLAASERGGLVRVTRGSCDRRSPVRPRVWISSGADGELTERSVPGLREGLGVVYRSGDVTIVGAKKNCDVVGFSSSDGGRTWSRGAVPRDVWWLDTDTSKSFVHGPVPNGEINVLCVPTSVTTAGDGGGRVACQGQSVLRLERGRGQVAESLPVASPAAVAQPAKGEPLVLGAQSDCAAALLRVSARSSSGSGAGDAEGADGSDGSTRVVCLSRSAAPLGLAVSGDRVFAQVGYRLMVSDDRGRSFEAYAKDPVEQ